MRTLARVLHCLSEYRLNNWSKHSQMAGHLENGGTDKLFIGDHGRYWVSGKGEDWFPLDYGKGYRLAWLH